MSNSYWLQYVIINLSVTPHWCCVVINGHGVCCDSMQLSGRHDSHCSVAGDNSAVARQTHRQQQSVSLHRATDTEGVVKPVPGNRRWQFCERFTTSVPTCCNTDSFTGVSRHHVEGLSHVNLFCRSVYVSHQSQEWSHGPQSQNFLG